VPKKILKLERKLKLTSKEKKQRRGRPKKVLVHPRRKAKLVINR